MSLTDLLATVPGLAGLLPYVTGLVAICAAVATMLPAPKAPASGWYPLVYHAINWAALNLGKARNAADPTR